MGDMFSQLVGNNTAHTDGRKCSSEWPTKATQQNVPAGHVIKVVAAALWLFL